MGWMFRNTSDLNYDGLKVKFLYNTEHTYDETAVGYSGNFELADVYARRLNTSESEPLVLTEDEEHNWELVGHRS